MKTFKNSRRAGISLVALVITIIVLIILTGAVILTFMEGGIIDRAKESVFKNDMRTYQEILALKRAENQMEIALGEKEDVEINASTLAEIQAIIPEFKEEYDGLIIISDGVIVLGEKVTGEELSSSEALYKDWLSDLGIILKEIEEDKEEIDTGIVHNGIIPEGGTYYVGIPGDQIFVGDYTGYTAKYEAGNEFPAEVNNGDTYVYGDYEYKYNMEYDGEVWVEDNAKDGWSVAPLDKSKTEYGEIMTTINNKNINNLISTFYSCTSLTKAPAIPNTVVNINGVFEFCESLTQAPVIPNSVVEMSAAFSGCTSLTEAPAIPSSVRNIEVAFSCTGITEAPVIPNGIKSLSNTFESTKITKAPIIPDSVENMSYTFSCCELLVEAPVIPSSVDDITWIFYECTSLTGTIEINANPTYYDEALYGTEKPITLTGSSTMLDDIAETAINGDGDPIGNVTVSQ